MSREHYLEPEEFDEYVEQGDFNTIEYIASDKILDEAQQVMEIFKKANKMASDFKYTCRCVTIKNSHTLTKWEFLYPEEDVEENGILDYILTEYDKMTKDTEMASDEKHDTISKSIDNFGATCQCPFWD